jgi:hypothetical protein
MPAWLRTLLENDGVPKIASRLDHNGKVRKLMAVENHGSDILPVVGNLLSQDEATRYAYLCHPCVLHISKLKKEGGRIPLMIIVSNC